MANQGFGAKGAPRFSPSAAPSTAADYELVADYAALVGNRKVGTRAQRLALVATATVENQLWNGLEFEQLDGTDRGLWKYLNNEWIRAKTSLYYLQDGSAPPLIPAPPAITDQDELIVQGGMFRFITDPQPAIGSEWSPTRSFPFAFPKGLISLQVTPILSDGLPSGAPHINSANRTNFRLIYPGSTTTQQRGVTWQAVGF